MIAPPPHVDLDRVEIVDAWASRACSVCLDAGGLICPRCHGAGFVDGVPWATCHDCDGWQRVACSCEGRAERCADAAYPAPAPLDWLSPDYTEPLACGGCSATEAA